MLYSILIYDSEAALERLSEEEYAARIEQHVALQEELRENGDFGPTARLMPTTAAVTLKPAKPHAKSGAAESLVIDGPFAESKEHLAGFYLIRCDSLDEAIERARRLPLVSGSLEIRPVAWFDNGILAADDLE